MSKISWHKKAKWYLRYCYHFNLIKYKVCIWIVPSSVCAIQVFSCPREGAVEFENQSGHKWQLMRSQQYIYGVLPNCWYLRYWYITLLRFCMKTNVRGQISGRSRQTYTDINICVLLDDTSQPDLIDPPLIHLETFACILLDNYVTLVTID